EPDRAREPLGPGQDVRPLGPRAVVPDRMAPAAGRSLGPPRPDRPQPLGRDAAPARDRARRPPLAGRPLPRRADERARSPEPARHLGHVGRDEGLGPRPRDRAHDPRHGRGGLPLSARRDHGPRQAPLRERARDLEARPRNGRAHRARDGAGRRRRGPAGRRRAGRLELAPADAPDRRVPGAAGRGHRPPGRGPPGGARLSDPAHDDRACDARGRLLLLHGPRPAGRIGPPPPAPPRPARGPLFLLLGVAAICQRAYVTLWRQPVLMISTMLFPVVYLLILGNALNRQLSAIPLAVVDEAG